MSTFITILMVIGLAVLGAATVYYKSSTKLQAKAAELINTAEGMYTDITKAGGKRFEWVVDHLYAMIPKAVQPFISKEKVGEIVQTTFDLIQAFAKQQLDKALNQ